MALDLRDYFVSYNSADAAHASAINAALRDAGYTTHFAGTDLPDGGNIPVWMDRALGASTQVLALCSPAYFSPEAVYSEVERAATFWADPDGARAMLVPVEIAPCDYSRLYAPLKRIDVSGKTPDAAAAALLAHLRNTDETQRREERRKAAAHPAVFNVPRGRVAHFVGREQALAGLHETLSQGRNAAVTQAIAGLGGIGKTTLAAEYAHRFGTAGRYAGVWWVPAETESGLVQSLGELAKRLGHPESQDLPAMARRAVEQVGASPQPWLIVFDNAPNPDALRYRQPVPGTWVPAGSARVLITSRWSDFSGIAETTRLDQWSVETTADYLMQATGRDDRAGAEALARALGGLPLAADQAAGYLRTRTKTLAAYAAQIDDFLKRERDRGDQGDYDKFFEDDAADGDRPQRRLRVMTVYATLVTSLDQLIEDGHTATVDLLCLLSWLSPDGTEAALIAATARQRPEFLSEPLTSAFADEDERDDAIRAAAVLSLLDRSEDADWGEMLVLHRVTATVLRVWQRDTGRSGWDVRAAQIVNAQFPGGDAPQTMPGIWPLCARLLPHARALASHGPRRGEGGIALDALLNQAGGYLAFTRGDTEGALEVLERALTLKESLYGNDDWRFALGLANLAGRYSDAGRPHDAKAAYKCAIGILEKNPDDNNLAIVRYNLGRVHLEQEEFPTAELLFLQARKAIRVAHGSFSAKYAACANAFGTLYARWAAQPGEGHRRFKAKRLNEEAIEIARAVCGERHPQVSHYLHNLTVLLARQEDFAAAAPLALRAVAIMLSLGMLEHPDTQQRIGDLLHYWERSGQGASAEEFWERVVPEIIEVERLMRDWVAEDPENRHFGPPPFEVHQGGT